MFYIIIDIINLSNIVYIIIKLVSVALLALGVRRFVAFLHQFFFFLLNFSLLFVFLEIVDKLGEVALWVLEEGLWAIKFSNFSIAHNHDFIALYNCLESMSNSDHGAVLELLVDQFLDHLLGFDIDIGSCFIEKDDLVLS